MEGAKTSHRVWVFVGDVFDNEHLLKHIVLFVTGFATDRKELPGLASTVSELELQAMQQYRSSDESVDTRLEREAREQYPY